MPETPPRTSALAIPATLGLLLLVSVWLIGGTGQAGAGDALAASAAGVFAFGCAVRAATQSRGGYRASWMGVAAGLAGWTVGCSTWSYAALTEVAPVADGSAAVMGYVILPLCACAAAVLVPYREQYGFGLGLLLDGIVIASSLLLALGGLVLDSSASANITRILVTVMTALYFGLAVIAALISRGTEPGRRLSSALLACSAAIIGGAGVAHLREDLPDTVPSPGVALGWVAGIYLVALSGLGSRPGPDLRSPPSGRQSRSTLWLPYLPASVAVVVGAVHFWPRAGIDAFLFSTLLMLVVAMLGRHLLALERKRLLIDKVADAALRDTVTGLANRRLLEERLAHAEQLHRRLQVPVSVLSIKVDDFAVVTSTLGYAASDALLRSVGTRIQTSVRSGDTLARLGGDEFAIVVEDLPDVAVQVAERIARAFDSELEIGDNRVHVRLSIGVASADSRDVPSGAAADLLSRAEAARSRAERTSGSDIKVYSAETDVTLGRRQTFRDGIARLQLLWDLRRAVDDRLLTLVYQPQFGMADGAVCGAEALLRWEHPTLGTLEPSQFLPLVREHGLMDAVTDLVLSRAVADGAAWNAAGSDVGVAVNLWARSLDEDELPERIMSVLDDYGLPANLLTVEITEELMVADFAKVRGVLNRLREAGIRVSIDDFGSGYSTLTYLRELPIDEVKLDHQLVAPILYDRRAATIARSVIELAAEFGIASVAEGIENEETAAWLRTFGCKVVQGNYFCGPLPAGEVPHVRPIMERS